MNVDTPPPPGMDPDRWQAVVEHCRRLDWKANAGREALLRFDAARSIARDADSYRRLGVDPDEAAERLVQIGLTFLEDRP